MRAPGPDGVYPERMVPRGLKDHRWSQEPRHPLLAVSILMIVIVTVVDILAPASVHLGPFLVAAPAVTASFAGPWTTAGVGVLAVTAQSVVAVVRTSLVDLNHSFQLITLILMSAFATTFAARREHHERELMQLRSVATAAQEVVLKPLPQRVGSLRIASVYLAAESEAQIGGDLYAAARTEHGIRIVIGDVRGKGLEAVGDAALLLGAFRGAAHRQADLPALMAFLEGTVSSNLDDPAALDATAEDRGEAFITAAALDIPDDEPVLHLINCGHPPPLLLHRDQVRPSKSATRRRPSVSPSSWKPSSPRKRSPSNTATSSFSTRTVSSRPVTARARSIRSPNGWRAGPAMVPMLSSPTCARTCCGTSADIWVTMPPWWRSSACRGPPEDRDSRIRPRLS